MAVISTEAEIYFCADAKAKMDFHCRGNDGCPYLWIASYFGSNERFSASRNGFNNSP